MRPELLEDWGLDENGDTGPIVPPELFDRVQRILDGKAGPTGPRTALDPEFPLRRFLHCSLCTAAYRQPLRGT